MSTVKDGDENEFDMLGCPRMAVRVLGQRLLHGTPRASTNLRDQTSRLPRSLALCVSGEVDGNISSAPSSSMPPRMLYT